MVELVGPIAPVVGVAAAIAMNTKQQRQADDIALVFAETRRIMSTPFAEISRDDMWFDLPHPSAPGKMICGRQAMLRLEHLAEEAGEQLGILRRVRRSRLVEHVGQELVQRFVRDGRPIDGKQIDRALSTAAKAARRACEDTTHLLPCHLMLSKDPDEIVLGPVRFLNRRAARRLLLGHAKARREKERATETGPRDDDDRPFLVQALKYYRHFNWIAQVEIKGCDRDVSETLARKAVTSALDCLHLALGAQWTDRMRIGGPALKFDRRAKLKISATGSLDYSLSSQGSGQVNFPNGWSERLEDPDMARVLELCGVALEAAVDPDLDRPLSRRLLDAAQWFGEAARDESPSTRVVKYVTALERMLMTEEHDDITTTVSLRLASLCAALGDHEDFERWRLNTRDTYDLRSRLVHGSLSPGAPAVRAGVGKAARLSESGILFALSNFGEDGLRADKISNARIARWFDGLVALVQEHLAALNAPSAPAPEDHAENADLVGQATGSSAEEDG